jgi:hypothetical protein
MVQTSSIHLTPLYAQITTWHIIIPSPLSRSLIMTVTFVLLVKKCATLYKKTYMFIIVFTIARHATTLGIIDFLDVVYRLIFWKNTWRKLDLFPFSGECVGRKVLSWVLPSHPISVRSILIFIHLCLHLFPSSFQIKICELIIWPARPSFHHTAIRWQDLDIRQRWL